MLRMVECETKMTQQASKSGNVDIVKKVKNIDEFAKNHVQFLQREVRAREVDISQIEWAIQMLESKLKTKGSY